MFQGCLIGTFSKNGDSTPIYNDLYKYTILLMELTKLGLNRYYQYSW